MPNSVQFAYRITHINNIPHILQYGIVRADSPNRNPNYIPIGKAQLIDFRRSLNFNGLSLANFIPFYFGCRSPMLYNIETGYNVPKRSAEEIVYLAISLVDILKSNINCVFTDGHATDQRTKFYPKSDLAKVNDIINYNDVTLKFWFPTNNDPERKRKKEAELLIESDIPIQYISAFAVYNENAAKKLEGMNVDPNRIFVRPDLYYGPLH